MPKRIIDGERLWRSVKLHQVEPPSFRSEYANLLPLALADGTFECSAERVWCDVYAFNRPDIDIQTVGQILDEFEKVKLLFRWQDDAGRSWGYWVGMAENKLLPTKKRAKTHRLKMGCMIPKEALKLFLNKDVTSEEQLRSSDVVAMA